MSAKPTPRERWAVTTAVLMGSINGAALVAWLDVPAWFVVVFMLAGLIVQLFRHWEAP